MSKCQKLTAWKFTWVCLKMYIVYLHSNNNFNEENYDKPLPLDFGDSEYLTWHQCGELMEPSCNTFCSGAVASLFQLWDKTSRFKRRRKQEEAASTLHMVFWGCRHIWKSVQQLSFNLSAIESDPIQDFLWPESASTDAVLWWHRNRCSKKRWWNRK